MIWPSKPWSKAVADLKPQMDDSGLVATWNMIPHDILLIDEKVGGADMTIYGANQVKTNLGDSLQFDGTNHYARSGLADFRSTDSQGTISFWFRLGAVGATQTIFSSSDEGSDVRFLNVLVTNTNYLAVHQVDNDVADIIRGGTALVAGKWYRADVVSDGSAYAIYLDKVAETLTISAGANNGDWFADTANRDNVTIGCMQQAGGLVNMFTGQIANVEVYSEAKDSTWVARKYVQGARMVQGKSDWGVNESVANDTTGFLSTSPWHISTGTHKITSDLVGLDHIKTVENIAAGIVYLHTDIICDVVEAAFGTWDFWVKKTDAGIQTIGIISTNTAGNGYSVVIGADESVKLEEVGVGDMITGGTLSADTWTNIKVTRTAAGLFSLYIDSALVGTATDLTITTSSYIVYDADIGDKLGYSDLNGAHSFVKHQGVI